MINNHLRLPLSLIILLLLSSCARKSNSINCDCEEIGDAGFNAGELPERFDNLCFQNPDRQSNKYSHSGHYSSELTVQSPYGMTYTIKDLKAGEVFQITAWRHRVNTKGVIVASFTNCFDLEYAQDNSTGKNENDWEEMKLDFIVPTIASGKELKIFVMNTGSDKPVYFDDLSITYSGFATTIQTTDTSFTDVRDNRVYHAVKVGNVWWMSENSSYYSANSFLYNNNIDSLAYGRLYTWMAAKDACPEGWYLASDSDWMNLEMTLGMPKYVVSNNGNRVSDIVVLMREFGSSGLNLKYGGAGSDSIVPGFYFLNRAGYYWTSTEIDSVNAWCRELNQWTNPGRFSDDKNRKFSVRCIKCESQL